MPELADHPKPEQALAPTPERTDANAQNTEPYPTTNACGANTNTPKPWPRTCPDCTLASLALMRELAVASTATTTCQYLRQHHFETRGRDKPNA